MLAICLSRSLCVSLLLSCLFALPNGIRTFTSFRRARDHTHSPCFSLFYTRATHASTARTIPKRTNTTISYYFTHDTHTHTRATHTRTRTLLLMVCWYCLVLPMPIDALSQAILCSEKLFLFLITISSQTSLCSNKCKRFKAPLLNTRAVYG